MSSAPVATKVHASWVNQLSVPCRLPQFQKSYRCPPVAVSSPAENPAMTPPMPARLPQQELCFRAEEAPPTLYIQCVQQTCRSLGINVPKEGSSLLWAPSRPVRWCQAQKVNFPSRQSAPFPPQQQQLRRRRRTQEPIW